MLARIMHRLRTIRASIEDTAEASLRAYEIISRLQNEQQPEDEYQPEDLDDPGEFSEEEYQSLLDKLQANMDEQQGEQGEGDPYESPSPWNTGATSSPKWSSSSPSSRWTRAKWATPNP